MAGMTTATLRANQDEIVDLQKKVAGLEDRLAEQINRVTIASRLRDEMEKQRDATRKQFDDLKQRLHDAEMENQRLRGYVARVQEDDAVREELVVTGDPGGESTLVPKRKLMQFARPAEPTDFEMQDRVGHGLSGYAGERRKLKHWVNY